MKAEINNENKARFFALYWGQSVYKHLHTSLETHVNESDLKLPLFQYSGVLELKALSQISDEDALEAAKLQDWESPDLTISKEDRRGIRDQIAVGAKLMWLNFLTVDYLRSRGYALPWMGLSIEEMIEAGWIKTTS